MLKNSMLRVVVKADFVCEGVCLQPRSYTCWRNFHMEKELKKKKKTFKRQKRLMILSYPVRKLCVFQRPFSLPFQKGLEEPSRKFSLFRFFFFTPKTEISNILTYLGQNIVSKKSKISLL